MADFIFQNRLALREAYFARDDVGRWPSWCLCPSVVFGSSDCVLWGATGGGTVRGKRGKPRVQGCQWKRRLVLHSGTLKASVLSLTWGQKCWEIRRKLERGNEEALMTHGRKKWVISLQKGGEDTQWCTGRKYHAFFCLLWNLVCVCVRERYPKYINIPGCVHKHRNGNTLRWCSFF